MDIEHPAFPGIVKASNAVDSDDFRSPVVAELPGDGAVGVAPCPHAMATTAARMTKYPRTLGPASKPDTIDIVVRLGAVRGQSCMNPSRAVTEGSVQMEPSN